ncbi:beta-lactamase/transpeptidase-like protein [Mollisia scopiformis]|uniref:Beta-lactamase/transpeptidase-like protein n=1 Tax=Mollisia scopiformis TaxID=149040 RepID=A0A194XWW2_MOLSC|nr:beta-lactamase/transpeptidase-like protein [Mollisia scopiformis]KUJ24544.1 beta-lactamase/transpeptidase-like protein [Mollisia scopiformis]
MATLIERFQALGPSISRVLSASGSAGAAIGVLHHGKVIHTAGYGFRDVDPELKMDEETVVSFFLLTNAMTASTVGVLVKENSVSGLALGRFLDQRSLKPLGMTRMSVVHPEGEGGEENISEGYVALSDGSTTRIERPFAGDDKIMFGAMGVNSCVKDLLTIYGVLLHAAADQFSGGTTVMKDSLFKQIQTVFSAHTPTGNPTLLNRSYGFGWHRSQLPNQVGASGENKRLILSMPIIARGTNSTTVLYHDGNSTASQNWIILVPEAHSAIIVLTNTMANCDASNWIACMLLDTLLDSPDKNDFEDLSIIAAKKNVDMWKELHSSLEKGQKPGTTPKPLGRYVGKYWNNFGNWYLEVYLEADELRMAFQSDREYVHALRHYHNDIFTLLLMQDENAEIGRYPSTGPGPWLLKFVVEEDTIKGMNWNSNGVEMNIFRKVVLLFSSLYFQRNLQ